MQIRQALLVLSLLAAATSAAAADRLITRRLANGMTVVLAPAVPGEAVALHLTLDAGSRHDPRSRPRHGVGGHARGRRALAWIHG